MRIRYVLYATLLSCALYALVFAHFVHKPLTIGIIKGYYEKKLDYLGSVEQNKIVLVAGSNGRFSHSCETLESEIGMPCSNMSISADISLDFQLDIIKPYLNPGDIVYLPLEYGAFSGKKRDMMSGKELPYVVAYKHSYLIGMNFERLMHALFYFDIKFLISGLGEMLLDHIGIKRRFTLDTMNKQGDESMHTSDKGRPYKNYLAELTWKPPTVDAFDESSYKAKIISDFMEWATTQGVTVIGGLPTTFDDEAVPDELIRRMHDYYTDNGHHFVVLESRSQYSREMFYDTPYHLSEEFQIFHSEMLSLLIKEIINR